MSAEVATILGAIFGAGGFGREVMPFVDQMWNDHCKPVFVETKPTRQSIDGYTVFSLEEFALDGSDEKYFNVAVSNSRARERLVGELVASGGKPVSIVFPNVISYKSADIGEGAIICANSVISANVAIGRYFHCNFGCYVAHDCVIGDFVTFAPAVQCLGNVHVGDHAYIGTGAILKQGSLGEPRRIGEGAVVGMGAVVTKDVPPYTTVVGNPARPLVK